MLWYLHDPGEVINTSSVLCFTLLLWQIISIIAIDVFTLLIVILPYVHFLSGLSTLNLILDTSVLDWWVSNQWLTDLFLTLLILNFLTS